MELLLGLDIGTSAVKAALIDRHGRLLAQAAREHAIHAPRPGWAEQEPHDWLVGVTTCARAVIQQAGVSAADVAGVGLAGQMHSLVCLGGDMQPLRPAILWADQRSGEQVQALTHTLGRAALAQWAGNPLAAGFQLASWLWLRQHEADLARQTRLLLLPKDFVRLHLTGQAGAEPSDASSTLLFDPYRREWSAPLLAAGGLEIDQLPPLHPSQAVAGGLLPEPAYAAGLLPGTPVIYGGSDVSMQALAQGITAPGTASITIGTGGQIFAPAARPAADPHLRLHLFCHALPGLWHHEAAMLSAGLCLRWLRDSVGFGDYNALSAAAAPVEAALDGLFFLPFLAGERTPYMNPRLQAGFVGLGLRHGRPHMIRAVFEGVCFALREGLALIEGLGGPVERILFSGGASASPFWRQLLADVLARPVQTAPGAEATARGAALLAGLGVGVYPTLADLLAEAVPEPGSAVEPRPQRAKAYAAAAQGYTDWAEVLNLQVGG